MSDKTQLYIIKQNALTNANVFWSKEDSRTEEKVLETATKYANWVLGEEELKPSLPPFPLPRIDDDNKKEWLNFNTPDYNKAIAFIKEGYTVRDLRTHFKVGNKVANELEKL
jgi:hypothetical protein